MNTDKVLALAKEAGYGTQIDVRNGLHTENIWGGELETAKVMRFAAMLQREMEAENAALNKGPIDPNKWAFDRGLESY